MLSASCHKRTSFEPLKALVRRTDKGEITRPLRADPSLLPKPLSGIAGVSPSTQGSLMLAVKASEAEAINLNTRVDLASRGRTYKTECAHGWSP